LPPTVEKRANIAVVLPTALKILTARHLHWPLTNVLRLGIMPTLSPYLLPLVLNKLYQGFPDLQLVLREDLTDNLLVALDAYKLDAVPILILNQISVYPTMPLVIEPFWLACPTGHRLRACLTGPASIG
jgi:LysR family transcriptional regulator, hydrogen peroxide-inducible genes activator